jgi:hypothetical protein
VGTIDDDALNRRSDFVQTLFANNRIRSSRRGPILGRWLPIDAGLVGFGIKAQ